MIILNKQNSLARVMKTSQESSIHCSVGKVLLASKMKIDILLIPAVLILAFVSPQNHQSPCKRNGESIIIIIPGLD